MKILLLCSGGDAPGMNRFIYDLYDAFKDEVYFALAGFNGLINGEIYPLGKVIKNGDRDSAGTIIKTSRCPEFKQKRYVKIGVNNAKDFDYVVICGGNGSERGAKEIFENGIKTIFVPGTIDNDVNDNHYSMGFSTAVKECVYAVKNTMPSIQAMTRSCLFEVMGRDFGAIAEETAKQVDADYVVQDKKTLDYEKMTKAILKKYVKGQSSCIIVRENIEKIEKIANKLNKMLGLDIVRCHIVGRTQRGGTPTEEELVMSDKFAGGVVDVIRHGRVGRVLANKNKQIVLKKFN